LHANSFRGICIQSTNKQKVYETINLLCAGNKLFVKHHVQGGLTPPSPLEYALEHKRNLRLFLYTVVCISSFYYTNVGWNRPILI